MIIIENRIQQLREDLDLTRKELAKIAGTTGSQIERLENGKSPMSVDWILSFSTIFAVYSDELFNMPSCKIDRDHCEPLLGFVIGWLSHACTIYKVKPGEIMFSNWVGNIYTQAKTHRMHYDDARTCIYEFISCKRKELEARQRTKQ